MANKMGMGLDLLLSEVTLGSSESEAAKAQIQQLAVTSLRPGKYQPRVKFKADELQLLADSIKQHGVLQPLVVRQVEGVDGYEIIAGERRWRASQQAGLTQVPAVVHALTDKQAMAVAIIENLQRENLTTWELVQALQHLIDKFNLSHEQVGKLIGYSRVAISNFMRLLDLPKPVQQLLAEEKIEMGHARALLAVTNAAKCIELAKRAADQHLSVRALEAITRVSAAAKHKTSKAARKAASLYQDLANSVAAKLGLTIKVKAKQVTITFKQHDALTKFLQRLERLA